MPANERLCFSMKNEIVILGERSKWVPVSSQRIQQVEEKNGNLLIDIMGKPGEVDDVLKFWLQLYLQIDGNYSQIDSKLCFKILIQLTCEVTEFKFLGTLT